VNPPRLLDAPPEHLAWIAERAQVSPGPGFKAIEAVDEAGRILAMVGWDGWTRSACCIHVALEHPAAIRLVLELGFHIPFVVAGLSTVVAQVVATNKRSLKLVRHLGFREVGRISDGWDRGVDLVLHEMRRDECRFIQKQDRRAA
jgi:hypothetical protein